MVGTQAALDTIQSEIDNSSLVIGDLTGFDPMGERREDQIRQWLAVLDQIYLERTRFRPYDLISFSEFFLDDTPTYGTMTTQIDMTIGLVHKEDALEEDILIDEPLPRLPVKVQPIKLKLRIRGRGKPTFRLETEIDLYDD
jgi:hypothetical protein